jgi:predicted small metal-binding protein
MTANRARKYIDCREFNRSGSCSLRISGTEAEVLAAAVEHAVSAHGFRGWEELRLVLRAALKSEA